MADQHDDDQSGSGLRAQLENALAEAKALREEMTGLKRTNAFRDAGIDTTKGVGRLLAERYDGDPEPEAILKFAKDYDIDVTAGTQQAEQEQHAQEHAQQERIAALRSESQPQGGGKRLSQDEWLRLTASDPRAAAEARANGMVDLDPRMEQQLATNRSVTRIG